MNTIEKKKIEKNILILIRILFYMYKGEQGNYAISLVLWKI